MLCASNEGGEDANGNPLGFHMEPCTGAKCSWWEQGGCTAGTNVSNDYRRWFKPDSEVPPCPVAAQCMWNVQALKRGEPACGVRRLGLLCEHQGGIWNTFDMAPPDDVEAWGT